MSTPVLISESLGWRLHADAEDVHLGISLEHLAELVARDGWVTLVVPRDLLNAMTREWAGHRAETESQHSDLLEQLITQVSAVYRLRVGKVLTDRAGRTPRLARHVIMFLARKHARLSYPEIARPFGMEHTSVLRAVTKIERLLTSRDPQWIATIQQVEQRLRLPHHAPAGPLPAGIAEVAPDDRDGRLDGGEE
jgi:hypothetical protein